MMIDVTTNDLINTLIVRVRATAKQEAILAISKTGANASKLRGAQRQERAALTALNRHLKMCVAQVKRSK